MSGLLFILLARLFAAAGRLADPLQPPPWACSRQTTPLPRRQLPPLRPSRTTAYRGSTNYHIQHLTFSTTRCYGHCPVFTLQIDSSGQTRYEARQYVAPQGVFTTSLPPATIQHLWQLVNALDFPHLPDKPAYLTFPETTYLDSSVYTLVITYGNGQQKIVGNESISLQPEALRQVYQALVDVQQTHPWK
jgi:hypothetical protein